jgi:predicted metal-dependent hydrolase
MTPNGYDPDYLQGIEHFNAHQFFEAHEVWEDVWARTTGINHLFYKGLIHAAVALHHFGNGNLHGAAKVWGSCLKYLSPYQPRHLGLDVEQFLKSLQHCFAPIEATPGRLPAAKLDENQIPTISLDPPDRQQQE